MKKDNKFSLKDKKRLADIQTLHLINSDTLHLKTLLSHHKKNTEIVCKEEVIELLTRLLKDSRRRAKELSLRLKRQKPGKWEIEHAQEFNDAVKFERTLQKVSKRGGIKITKVKVSKIEKLTDVIL